MFTLVTTATGQVGRATVRDLLARRMSVRAATRHPDADHRLPSECEVVRLDPRESTTLAAYLDEVLDGVDRVFLASANHAGQVAFEMAVIDAAARAGVRRIVKLSGPNPSPDAELVTDRWHAQIEAHLGASGIPSVSLRPSSFMTNLLALADPVRTAGALPAPTAAARVAFIDPRDVAAVSAALLAAPRDPSQASLVLTGPEALSYDEIATAVAGVTGRPVAFLPVTPEQARQAMESAGLPGDLVELFLAVYRLQREGHFAAVTDTLPRVLGRPARTIEEFVADHRDSFVAPVGG